MEECASHRQLFYDGAGVIREEICDEDVARALRSLCHSQVVADLNVDLAKAG